MRTASGSRRRWIIGVVLTLSVGPSQRLRAQDRPVRPGRGAPGFTLSRLDGGRLDLTELRGHPVVVNFWATWCQACRTELPLLDSAWSAHRSEGLEVVAINLTDQEHRRDVDRFVQRTAMTFTVLLDERGATRERYGLTALPTTVFVDASGNVRAVRDGPLSGHDLAEGLATILPP